MRWGTTEHLLATIIDGQRDQMYQYALAHTGKGKTKPKRPKPIERPGIKPKDEPGTRRLGTARLSIARLRAILDARSKNPANVEGGGVTRVR